VARILAIVLLIVIICPDAAYSDLDSTSIRILFKFRDRQSKEESTRACNAVMVREPRALPDNPKMCRTAILTAAHCLKMKNEKGEDLELIAAVSEKLGFLKQWAFQIHKTYSEGKRYDIAPLIFVSDCKLQRENSVFKIAKETPKKDDRCYIHAQKGKEQCHYHKIESLPNVFSLTSTNKSEKFNEKIEEGHSGAGVTNSKGQLIGCIHGIPREEKFPQLKDRVAYGTGGECLTWADTQIAIRLGEHRSEPKIQDDHH